MFQRFGITILAIFVGACGASRTLKPLGSGNSQADFSVGGPFVTQGVSVPAPYTVLGYSYGLTDIVNVNASLHPTAMLFKNLGMELGATTEIFEQMGEVPELVLDTRLLMGSDFGGFVAFPAFTPILSYEFDQWATPYIGGDIVFQFHENDAPYFPQSYSPFAGFRAQVSEAWSTGGEIKWTAINHDTEFSSIEHPNLSFHKGQIAPYFFVGYRF